MDSERQEPRFVMVPVDLLNGVLNYLTKQPWAEVNPFIAALGNLVNKSQGMPPLEAPKEKDVQ